MSAASPTLGHTFRSQLLERRARLQAAASTVPAAYLNDLLAEVDAALHRIDNGSYGFCETCQDPIEPDRLEGNPLVRFCLDHLSRAELQAHQQDLELATEIQARLLPPRDMALESWEAQYRYEPAGAVSGDYCELIRPAGGESLFFAVGDVAGKGVAASLLMTHLNAIFRSLAALDLSLVEMVARANRLFCEGTGPAHYATLVCGRATPDAVELCNAGHCTPLLLRGGAAEKVDSTGLPLGLFSGVEFAVRRLHLRPGDSLVLYTDGITEAQDPAGEEYGEDRLIRALRDRCDLGGAGMADGVIRDVGRFRQARAAADDMTLLVVRRRG